MQHWRSTRTRNSGRILWAGVGVIPQVSRYVRMFQSRRSLLAWKILGYRCDGWTNDDFPTETVAGDRTTLECGGKPVEPNPGNIAIADLDFTGSFMPPPMAVFVGKVQPLSDDDRRTIIRWIDLGCPIDLDFNPRRSDHQHPSGGWMVDETRPTLTVTHPHRGPNRTLERLLIGMDDCYSGLDMRSFSVIADFDIDNVKAGENLAFRFKQHQQGVWQWRLTTPIRKLDRGRLAVSIKDRQGNTTKLVRTFSVRE